MVSSTTSARQRYSLGLSWQLDALAADLQSALNDLDSIEERARTSIPKRAYAVGEFRKDLTSRLNDAKDLRRQLRDGRAEASDLWNRLAVQQRDAEQSIQRQQAFTRAMLARSEGPEQEGCALADAFLDYLAAKAGLEWKGFTLRETGESFDELPEIIRLKASATDLWNLPVAAHELGHFMLSPRKKYLPDSALKPLFDAYIARRKASSEAEKDTGQNNQQKWTSDEQLRHTEYFADCFATWVLGPAYVCTCLLLRFLPGAPNQPLTDHPADGQRAIVMTALLERMNDWDKFSEIGDACMAIWREAEQEAAAAAWDGKALDQIAVDSYRQLRDGGPQLEYKNCWPAVATISDQLAKNSAVSDRSLIDLLNGMWRARLLGLSYEIIETKAVSAAKAWRQKSKGFQALSV